MRSLIEAYLDFSDSMIESLLPCQGQKNLMTTRVQIPLRRARMDLRKTLPPPLKEVIEVAKTILMTLMRRRTSQFRPTLVLSEISVIAALYAVSRKRMIRP